MVLGPLKRAASKFPFSGLRLQAMGVEFQVRHPSSNLLPTNNLQTLVSKGSEPAALISCKHS
jgi:hypothetical protein